VTSEAETVHDLLKERGETVATAESLTGGQLAALLTAAPGASETFLGGVVSYATAVKIDVLGVEPGLVERYGVVSAECARAMARGVRSLMRSTYAVSTTGVAGPDEQEGKSPGTVYVGVAGPSGDTALALELVGSRSVIQDRTCAEALSALADMIVREEETGVG
jgi:nicotinamide-nucleotide amidase